MANEVQRLRASLGADAAGARATAVEVAPEIRRGEISLVTPGGHRVEGLDVEKVAVLLARLA
jgi:hypothetical protein